jgi:hypothetical protein
MLIYLNSKVEEKVFLPLQKEDSSLLGSKKTCTCYENDHCNIILKWY